MTIDLSQLHCFLTLCREKNFSRAAERMNMTQPPFSRQIRLLESRLGVILFDRTTRKVELTEAGKLLKPQIETTVASASAIPVMAQELIKGTRGRVRLGFTPSAAYGLLARLVKLVRDEFPKIEVLCNELSTTEQAELFHENGLDVGILRPPSSLEGLDLCCIRHEPLRIALPQDHPLAQECGPLDITNLKGSDFILFSSDYGDYMHNLVARVLSHGGIVPERVQYVRSAHSMLPLVARGLGVAIIPEDALKLGVQNIVVRELDASEEFVADHYFVRRTSARSAAVDAVVSLFQKHMNTQS